MKFTTVESVPTSNDIISRPVYRFIAQILEKRKSASTFLSRSSDLLYLPTQAIGYFPTLASSTATTPTAALILATALRVDVRDTMRI